jgi:hypothetical protein
MRGSVVFFPPFFLFIRRAVDENGDVVAGVEASIEGALRCAKTVVGSRDGRRTGRKAERFIVGAVQAQLGG